MEKYSLGEVIEQAVRTERLGYDFYSGMAEQFSKDRKLATLFSTLADKEKAHEKRFEGLKSKVKETEPEGWVEVSEYLRAIVESEFFLGKHKSLPSLSHVRTVNDAITFALGFEKETLLYFHAIRDFLADNTVITEIIDEERRHIVWLSGYRP